MPSINGTTTEDTGSVFTSFTGSASTTSQNFTFASQQDGMRFSNKGNSAMSVTINGKTHKIPPNAVIEIDDDPFDSFDVVTASGTNSFEGRAYTRKGGSSSGVDAYARAQLTEITPYNNYTTVPTFTGERLTQVEELDGAVVRKRTTITYNTDGSVKTVTDVLPGKTIVSTLNYVNGAFSSVSKTLAEGGL